MYGGDCRAMDAFSFLFLFSFLDRTGIAALCKSEGVLQCFGSALFFYADPYPGPGSKKSRSGQPVSFYKFIFLYKNIFYVMVGNKSKNIPT
jgi:hypothetical protein